MVIYVKTNMIDLPAALQCQIATSHGLLSIRMAGIPNLPSAVLYLPSYYQLTTTMAHLPEIKLLEVVEKSVKNAAGGVGLQVTCLSGSLMT